eukprot:6052984-Amphidinium_carterae.1
MVLQRAVRSGDSRMDELLWKTTLEEVDRAWLHGPMEIGEAIKVMGDTMVPARRLMDRVMVVQKDTARPVDDNTCVWGKV